MKLNKTLITFIFSVGLVACSDDKQTHQSEQLNERQAQLTEEFVGKRIPFDKYSEMGSPETLAGTDNTHLVVYFPKADLTIISIKQSNVVIRVYPGKHDVFSVPLKLD